MRHPARRAARVLALASVFGPLLAGACTAPKASTARHVDSARAGSDSSPPRPESVADIRAFDTLSVARIEDTTIPTAPPPMPHLARQSPLADSIAATMVFFATIQRTFLAASRAKKLLMDIGRVDHKIATPAARKAYDEAVHTLSPVHVGDRFRISGAWGSEDATVSKLSQWNGRIAAVLAASRRVDSLAKLKAPLIAFAERADSALPPTTETCKRDSVDAAVTERIPVVRDSLLAILQADTLSLTERLLKTRRARSSQAIGCFKLGHVILFVSQVAGDYEYAKQFAVILGDSGQVTPLRVADLRFKVHDAIEALDADGDGVDDIAVRGHAARIGGTVILRLNPTKKRLEYMAGGFAWETF